jgi:hypothetical protein
MDSDWVHFFELAERLKGSLPASVELALQFCQSKDPAVFQKLEHELSNGAAAEHSLQSFFHHSQYGPLVEVSACVDFLEQLGKQEAALKAQQETIAHALSQVQEARRAFDESFKEMMRAEQRRFSALIPPEMYATEEEIMAGLQELKEHGGKELHEFSGELEQVLNEREHVET